MTAPPLVLASASPARRRLLEAAGVAVEVLPAAVDEAALKASLRHEGAPAADAALALAELKAARVSGERPGALVAAADQILDCEGRWFDKPGTAAAAREDLRALRGRAHTLATAACVARDGTVIWRHASEPRLTMRAFSDAFLDDYLKRAGEEVLVSVGAYQVEGLGAQLFARIDGDWTAIQGLPLLPLLEFLRGHRALLP